MEESFAASAHVTVHVGCSWAHGPYAGVGGFCIPLASILKNQEDAGLSLVHNVRFELASPDMRPAIVCDDLEGLDRADFQAEGNDKAECLIRIQQARQVFIHGSRSLHSSQAFLRVEGGESREIGLNGNDLRQVRGVVDLGEGVSQDAVDVAANLGPR